jgi:DNA-binding response OmpR family regulator
MTRQRSDPIGPLPPIVIAEDDVSVVRLLDVFLDDARLLNPRIVTGNGDDAVEILAGLVAGDGEPALVLLDGGLPGRSGLEVLRWMRAQPTLATLPVVMLTGTDDLASITDAYAAGVTSYLVKPVGIDALADVLRGLDTGWALMGDVCR